MKKHQLQRREGFTLIELVLTIIVIAILAASVNIGINGISSARLNGAARRLVSDLRFAQQAAITKRIRHGIIFTANSYTVFENDLPADPARNPQGGGDFIVNFTSGDFAGVTIGATLPGSVVKFEPSGRPLDGANAALTPATNQVTLSYSGSPMTVTIIPETGKISY